MDFLQKAQRAINEEKLDGWLFFNFHGRDTLANRLLGLNPSTINTRAWFCFIPASGQPVKVVHAIEKHILDALPGESFVYSTRQELSDILAPMAGTYGAQISSHLTVISSLDYGTGRYLENLGFSLVSSAGLIQKTGGILDERGIESHERAAALLYRCIHNTWEKVQAETREGMPLLESTVQGWIFDFFNENDLITDHPILVAAGKNTADPHYEVPQSGELIKPGDIIQFDIWAKENTPKGIYADISWVAILSEKTPHEAEQIFAAVKGARDKAIEYISVKLDQGLSVKGEEVDTVTRNYIGSAGYGAYICHRTGHGIDTEVHGSGVNIDAFEFPDSREIIEGSCFSIEPGIYLEDFGMRTEIDAYRWNNALRVSGGPKQEQILTL